MIIIKRKIIRHWKFTIHSLTDVEQETETYRTVRNFCLIGLTAENSCTLARVFR
jgi:hypothetical protein